MGQSDGVLESAQAKSVITNAVTTRVFVEQKPSLVPAVGLLSPAAFVVTRFAPGESIPKVRDVC